jgi:twinkle protein
LAGIQLQRPVHLPDSGYTDDQIINALEAVVPKDDKLYVYSHFGSDDPDVLLDTIRFLVSARNVSYILFDHITMAVSGLAGENERRALDYLSTRLEMLVKELNFSLIIVSHVNDEGQTRGSRNISKVCDVRIDLTRDVMSPDPILRNTIHTAIPYNRFCGRSGPAGDLLYNPATGILKEAVNDNVFQPPDSPTLAA